VLNSSLYVNSPSVEGIRAGMDAHAIAKRLSFEPIYHEIRSTPITSK
jgi:hypothetical protein